MSFPPSIPSFYEGAHSSPLPRTIIESLE